MSKQNKIKNTAIAIAGNSGSGKSTMSKILLDLFKPSVLLECDRYHRWERGDDNWQFYTHLDPSANKMELMYSDLDKLINNETILQVDYDHSIGRFTKKNEIKPQKFILVCGLHSFYYKKTNPYVLKIYMDTEEQLQVSWKLNRDKIKRGYSYKQVVEQMEKRQEDYEKFIFPQKKLSDLSIRFMKCKGKKMSYSLEVEMNKEYELSFITNFFYSKGVDLEVSKGREKNILFFKRHKNLCETSRYDNFYDYLSLIIESLLNVKN